MSLVATPGATIKIWTLTGDYSISQKSHFLSNQHSHYVCYFILFLRCRCLLLPRTGCWVIQMFGLTFCFSFVLPFPFFLWRERWRNIFLWFRVPLLTKSRLEFWDWGKVLGRSVYLSYMSAQVWHGNITY